MVRDVTVRFKGTVDALSDGALLAWLVFNDSEARSLEFRWYPNAPIMSVILPEPDVKKLVEKLNELGYQVIDD